MDGGSRDPNAGRDKALAGREAFMDGKPESQLGDLASTASISEEFAPFRQLGWSGWADMNAHSERDGAPVRDALLVDLVGRQPLLAVINAATALLFATAF